MRTVNMTNIARHLRRLAENHIERYVNRLVIEVPIINDETSLGVRAPHHREGTAFTFTDRA